MTKRGTAVITIMVLIAVLSASISAHPTGTTSVSIAPRNDQAIEISITADADPLAAKLEALAREPQASSTATAAVRIAALRQVVLDHVVLTVGQEPSALEWLDVAVNSDARVTIRLVARGPYASAPIVWRTSLVFGSYALVVRPAGSSSDVVEWLQGTESGTPVMLEAPAARWRAMARALRLGVLHILPNGFDHILFVLGLFLLSTRTRQVLAQVSAFTLAHSLTLGLTLYGVIALPARVVEPLIALSVAYVGIENLVTSELKPWRVAIVFAFGLLHGMGFAEAISNLHLARSQFLTTLVGFNLGVEAAQLAVIAMAALTLRLTLRSRQTWRLPVSRFASAGIGACGLVWMLSRLA